MKIFFLLLAMCFCQLLSAQKRNDRKTIILSDIPPTNLATSLKGYYEYYKRLHKDNTEFQELQVVFFNSLDLNVRLSDSKERIIGGKVKWVLNLDAPVIMKLPFLRQGVYINPGDSLNIDFIDGIPVASGKGAETFNLQYGIAAHENNSTLKPKQVVVRIDSIGQFFNWQKYLDGHLLFAMNALEAYKSRIPKIMYDLIKNSIVKDIEYNRVVTYVSLSNYRIKNPGSGISVQDLKNTADTILNKPWAKWLRSQFSYIGDKDVWYFYQYARIQVWNRMQWNYDADQFNTNSKRILLYRDEINRLYKGLLHERIIQYLLVEDVIKEMGYQHPLTKVLLHDYYKQPGFPEYKQWMRDYEKVAAVKYNFGRPQPEREKSPELKLSIQNDGPYVLYKGDTVQINTVINGKPFVENKKTKSITIKVSTDQYPQTFTVQLKSSLQEEAAVYKRPEKQLVLSDIEGNFDALRKLLQSNGVIDKNYNWIFGSGHLVCVGDFFDRGEQVTEVLWLIYSLEDKAKAAGGYVHFILGNHEILNLSNDQRYVKEKYKHNANLLKIPYRNLYDGNSELGKWLRTKNIVEKIGDVIYTHGGLAREINNFSLSLEQINATVRPYLDKRDDFKQNKQEPELMALFSGTTSPFWYRGYYDKDENKKTKVSTVDSTLQKFNVIHIVTGHTVVADTVSMHYEGKVFNTDTHHAEGKSEALLIADDKFYRVNDKGRRWLLYDERKKK